MLPEARASPDRGVCADCDEITQAWADYFGGASDACSAGDAPAADIQWAPGHDPKAGRQGGHGEADVDPEFLAHMGGLPVPEAWEACDRPDLMVRLLCSIGADRQAVFKAALCCVGQVRATYAVASVNMHKDVPDMDSIERLESPLAALSRWSEGAAMSFDDMGASAKLMRYYDVDQWRPALSALYAAAIWSLEEGLPETRAIGMVASILQGAVVDACRIVARQTWAADVEEFCLHCARTERSFADKIRSRVSINPWIGSETPPLAAAVPAAALDPGQDEALRALLRYLWDLSDHTAVWVLLALLARMDLDNELPAGSIDMSASGVMHAARTIRYDLGAQLRHGDWGLPLNPQQAALCRAQIAAIDALLDVRTEAEIDAWLARTRQRAAQAVRPDSSPDQRTAAK